MSELFWLTDAQMARLRPLLANKPRGVPRVDDRRVISGIIHVLRSGCRWADAPSAYGPRKTLYNRFVRWAAQGVWLDVFQALAAEGGPPAEVLLDSTHAKAHRCAAGGKGAEFIGRDLDLWAFMNGVTLHFSRPGKPTDNAITESFNGKLRAECLNGSWFLDLEIEQKPLPVDPGGSVIGQ